MFLPILTFYSQGLGTRGVSLSDGIQCLLSKSSSFRPTDSCFKERKVPSPLSVEFCVRFFTFLISNIPGKH